MGIQKYYDYAIHSSDRFIYNKGYFWYVNAHKQAERIAENQHVSVNTVCGIIAALSPNNKWYRNIIDADNFVRTGGNCKVCTFGPNKAKAQRILNGEYPLDVLKGNKVINFYHCILRPDNNTFVCIDRHAFRAAYDLGVNSEADALYTKILKRINGYELIADEYRKFAAKAGLLPNQVQAIVWEAYREFNQTKGR